MPSVPVGAAAHPDPFAFSLVPGVVDFWPQLWAFWDGWSDVVDFAAGCCGVAPVCACVAAHKAAKTIKLAVSRAQVFNAPPLSSNRCGLLLAQRSHVEPRARLGG